MKKTLRTIIAMLTVGVMLMAFTAIQAQKISYIQAKGSWYYVYDENGKKVNTFSTTTGEVVAYSESFYIIKKGSWYYTCDPKGKRLHTFSETSVGEVLSAAGDTFTSRKGEWIYTWDKKGKKIATRSAR